MTTMNCVICGREAKTTFGYQRTGQSYSLCHQCYDEVSREAAISMKPATSYTDMFRIVLEFKISLKLSSTGMFYL